MCRGIGYKGRIGIYEILRVTEKMHDPIVRCEAAPVIRYFGLQVGMVLLGKLGWNLVDWKLMTLEEVVCTIFVKEGDFGRCHGYLFRIDGGLFEDLLSY